MESEKVPKKQHFVPQYYLRRFADDKNRLWVYDQKRSSIYQSRTNDVCERNFHYEIEATAKREWHGRHFLPGKIELGLSRIESRQAALLRKIDEQLENGRIHEKERRSLCWLIGNLIARHPVMLEDHEPDYATLMEDPDVKRDCEILEQLGMGNEIGALARGANQMVLALWRRKNTPTNYIQEDLKKLQCMFIKTGEEARFITSSLPPHLSVSIWEDGDYHLDYLALPLSSTFAVIYSKNGSRKSKIRKISDEEVIGLNADYFISEPTREQILSGRKEDLQQARKLAGSFRLREATANSLESLIYQE